MINQNNNSTETALCPICVFSTPETNDFCVVHKPTWEIKPFVVFGRHSGFGIYSEKFMNGEFPAHISITEKDAKDFFYNEENQPKLQEALRVQISI